MCEHTEHEGAEVAPFTLPSQCRYHAQILHLCESFKCGEKGGSFSADHSSRKQHPSSQVKESDSVLSTDVHYVIMSLCHFPGCLVGQNFNHNSIHMIIKQLASTWTGGFGGNTDINVLTCTTMPLLDLQHQHAVWIDILCGFTPALLGSAWTDKGGELANLCCTDNAESLWVKRASGSKFLSSCSWETEPRTTQEFIIFTICTLIVSVTTQSSWPKVRTGFHDSAASSESQVRTAAGAALILFSLTTKKTGTWLLEALSPLAYQAYTKKNIVITLTDTERGHFIFSFSVK